LAVVFTVGCLA